MPTAGGILCGCGRFLRVKKNSVTVEEQCADGSPYRLWSADLCFCPECKAEIISGFANRPLTEHWQTDYDTIKAERGPIYPGRCAPAVTPVEQER